MVVRIDAASMIILFPKAPFENILGTMLLVAITMLLTTKFQAYNIPTPNPSPESVVLYQ